LLTHGSSGSSCAADVVLMHRMQRVGPSGAFVVRPERVFDAGTQRRLLERAKEAEGQSM
jgi:hypothetical protein